MPFSFGAVNNASTEYLRQERRFPPFLNLSS
jgi:hypothetical protein